MKIVNYDGKAPYTFAVLTNGNDFMAVPKRDDTDSVDAAYRECIETDPMNPYDDATDKPKDNADGDRVAAICYVSNVGMSYEIVITSYINGEKALTIKVPYSHQEKLLIYPEAYRQTEALPLSDYVLVDGKLGGRWVWNYATQSEGESKAYEHLLPWITLDEQSRLTSYASSDKYPAVFKYPAAASTGLAGGETIEKPDTTPKNWVMPTVSTAAQNGSIRMNGTNGKTIQIYYNSKWNTLNKDNSTVYYNGSTTYPTVAGKYTVTVDYKGTGTYVKPTDANPNPVNIMPRYGMVVGEITIGDFTEKNQSAPERLNVSIDTYDSSKHTVKVILEAQNDEGRWSSSWQIVSNVVCYGYSTGSSDQIVWKTGEAGKAMIFDLPVGESYYFYCYIPGYIDTIGAVHNASDVVIGNYNMHLYSATTTPSGNGKYYMMNSSGYAAGSDLKTSDYGTITNSLFYSTSSMPGNSYQWTLSGNGNTWTFKNSSGNYLGITQTKDSTPSKEYPYTYAETTSGSSQTLNVNSDGIVSYTFYRDRYEKKEETTGSGCNAETRTWWDVAEQNLPYTHYLQIGNSKLEDTTSSSSAFYFVEAPDLTYSSALEKTEAAEQIVNPFYTVEGFTVESDTNVINEVNAKLGQIQSGLTATSLTANGQTVTNTLNPGTYMLRGTTSDGKQIVPFKVTVKKAVLDDTLSVTAERNGDQDHEMKATGSGWHGENGGIRYFAYQFDGDTYWDYSESTAAECSVVFMVDYKIPYSVWVEESGTWAYEAGPKSDTVLYSITAKPVDTDGWVPTDFVYSFDEEGNVRWHAIPDGITVDQITNLVYRYENPETGTASAWTTDATHEYNSYGVTVAGSQYEDVANAFEIGPPLAVTNVNGHCTSMVKGSSLYFMGEGNSLNTFGNSVFLYTDLLVLKNNITGGGQVWLDTYSNNKTHVLLFAVNDIKMAEDTPVFKAQTFYLIPAGDNGIDLYGISPAEAETYYKGHINYESLAGGDDTLRNVRPLYQNQGYPAPNMDIAFANSNQLGAIRNSEDLNGAETSGTGGGMGWTIDGVLQGSASSNNSSYVVCAYVSDVSSANSISYGANRIMIAAKEDDVREVLSVPVSVTFTTRYLSIDAHTIEQDGSAGAITLKNLGKSQSFIDSIKGWLGVGHVESRTLQIDYEQAATLRYSGGGERRIPRQVYRYDHNTNIFGDGTLEHEIMVEYTTEEINSWFTGGLGGFLTGSTVAILDRYITIGAEETGGTLSIPTNLWNNTTLSIYSNYIHFGKDLKTTDLSEGKIIINCQENGYTTGDYLVYFKSSADSYSGTLLYFAADTTFITSRDWRGNETKVTIDEGFYYIYATSSGTDLTKLATDLYTGEDLSQNTSKKPFRVDPDSLDDYSVYIRRDGGISSAYVETVLENTGSLGAYFGKAEVE